MFGNRNNVAVREVTKSVLFNIQEVLPELKEWLNMIKSHSEMQFDALKNIVLVRNEVRASTRESILNLKRAILV